MAIPRLLTVRKEAWINRFKPDIIKGTPLNPNMAVALRYYGNLARLIEEMAEEAERGIARLFTSEAGREFFGEDKTFTAQARSLTVALKKKYDMLFGTSSQRIAEAFANQSDKASSSSLHSSIVQLSGGLSLPTTTLKGPLKDILAATINENVSLIKSIPQAYLTGVEGAVMRSITTGNGLKTLIPYLANNKGITLRRARMIAYDQTRKAFNGLDKGRMQQIGIEEYEWLHSGGSNQPRPLHVKMSGNIYRFDDPPIIDADTGERGIPGQLPNCGCRMRPVINFGRLKNAA